MGGRPERAAPEDLARGELAEETGLRAGRMEHLGQLFFAYGITDQSFDVWRATGLEPGAQALEATEADLRVARFAVAEFEAMIAAAGCATRRPWPLGIWRRAAADPPWQGRPSAPTGSSSALHRGAG